MNKIDLNSFSFKAKKHFCFLENYMFKLIIDEDRNIAHKILYKKDDIWVYLHFDFLSLSFSFSFRKDIKGIPSDYSSPDTIIDFEDIILKQNSQIVFENLHPDGFYFEHALELNAIQIQLFFEKHFEGKFLNFNNLKKVIDSM